MSFDVLRSFVCRRLGLFRFAARFIDRSQGGPTVSIAHTIRARTRGGDTSLQKEKGVVSRMKQRHNPDARAYHEYYLNQTGRGYPVYVGTRYQRGHGLGSKYQRAVLYVVEGASHHFSVSSCHRYDSQQWSLSISHHPRFDQGAIHVQRIY
jgi:hypothetical protein